VIAAGFGYASTAWLGVEDWPAAASPWRPSPSSWSSNTGGSRDQRPIGLVLEVAEAWARAAQAAAWQREHALVLLQCGLLHSAGRGAPDAAVACFGQARHEAAAAGDFALAALSMADRAEVEMRQGRVRVAQRRSEAARQLAHHHHAPFPEAAALRVLSKLAGRAGDWDGALAAAMAGAVMAERAGDHELLAWLLQALTDAQEHLGRVGQLVPLSVSCAHPETARYVQRPQGNCGYCFPCLIRRSALAHVGWDDDAYAWDVLSEGGLLDRRTRRGADLRAVIAGAFAGRPDSDALRNGPLPAGEREAFVGVWRRGLAEIRTWLTTGAKGDLAELVESLS
jgi:hypothetical protein